PSMHGLIDCRQRGFVITGDENFECRHEVKEILTHKSRGDRVAARNRFYLYFVPTSSFLGLLRDDETRAGKLRQVCRVLLAARCHECRDGRGGRVAAEDALDRVEKRPLAIGTRAVTEDEDMLDGDAAQAVAHIALQKLLQLFVAGRDAVQECRK